MRPAAGALLLLPAAAFGVELDAASAARAGAARLERLEVSPAAPFAPRAAFGIDVRRIDAEAGVEAVAVRIASARGRLAVAATCDRVQSPVHTDIGLACAAAWRRGGGGLGAGVELRRLAFTPQVSVFRARARAGASVRRGGAAVAAVVEVRTADEAPRVAVAARAAPAPGVVVETELERRPGQAANARVALGLGGAGAEIWCGYETATRVAAAGAGVGVAALRVAAAVRVHPELGWSPTWSCEWRR
jgi:hypothetical protein